MRVGVKVYSDTEDQLEHAKKASKFADFIEVMAVPGTDVSRFKSIKKPFVIHAPHDRFGCNIADKSLFKHSIECLNHATKAADILGARVIVVHPGHLKSGSCSLQQAIKVLLKVNDSRIALENLFAGSGESGSMCSTPEHMRHLMDKTNCGLCLDFSHACAASNAEKEGHKEFVKRFISLKPAHFHISGGHLALFRDTHESLFSGDYPIDYFKRILPEDAWVTLETPQDINIQKKECEFLRK